MYEWYICRLNIGYIVYMHSCVCVIALLFCSCWGCSAVPRYKQEIGRRLSLAALSRVYGYDVGRWQGPFPTRIAALSADNLEVEFDDRKTQIKLNTQTGFSGFEVNMIGGYILFGKSHMKSK